MFVNLFTCLFIYLHACWPIFILYLAGIDVKKRFLTFFVSFIKTEASILGVAPHRIWTRGSWGSQGVVDGSWYIIISYHVQEVCLKVATFEEIE